MLVMTRKINEVLLLGDDIKIVVLDIEAERVKIGIEAPRSMKILRAELLKEVETVNHEANLADLSVFSRLEIAAEIKDLEINP